MAKLPLVVSVQHTGSRFLAVRLGLREIFHTNRRLLSVFAGIQDRPVCTPLRHPKDVWHSWCKRGKSAEHEMFLNSFYTLAELAEVYPLDIIAVDKQEDPRITNWEKIANNDTVVECPDIDLSKVMAIPFVRQHYGD